MPTPRFGLTVIYFQFLHCRVSGLDEESEEEQEKEEKQAAEPEGLKILTAENFKTFLSETEHVVVMFYAPCKNLRSNHILQIA